MNRDEESLPKIRSRIFITESGDLIFTDLWQEIAKDWITIDDKGEYVFRD